ncbi:hypothetical protein ACIQ2M_06335 [Methylobacterium sp. NPDC097299]|uniref:hypothetical protein n=1 Tax=unclassified Methylobacterium TaxID=2615210 RepID=UPI003839DE6F
MPTHRSSASLRRLRVGWSAGALLRAGAAQYLERTREFWAEIRAAEPKIEPGTDPKTQ